MIFAYESQLSKDNTEEVDKLHVKIGQLTVEIELRRITDEIYLQYQFMGE